MTLLAVVVCVLALCGAGLAMAVTWRAWRERRALLPLVAAPLTSPLLVVIPARNEAARLPRTLAALLREPSPLLRVIVVDDASTDETAQVVATAAAADARLTLLRPTWPPQTSSHSALFGKPRALHAAIATDIAHDVIVCLDADVFLEAGALGGLRAALATDDRIAAVSVAPRLDDVTFVERLLVPAFVAAASSSAPPSRVHDPARPEAFLNGQVIAVRRAALDDVGGFAAVSGTVLEDVALARRLKHKGYGLRLLDGRALVATRMYEGAADIVAGFSKNARALHGARLAPLGVALIASAWLPWLAALGAAVTIDVIDDGAAAVGVVVALAAAALNRRALGSQPLLALCGPLAVTIVGVVYVRAALARTQRWRGRTFRVVE